MPRDAFSQDWALEHYRDYLYLLSRVGVNERLRALAESSDIVQQTLLKAHERIGQFQGTSEAEFRAWLRTILARQLTDLASRTGSESSPWRRYWISHGHAWSRGSPIKSARRASRQSGANSFSV
jgi:DNA-directed RNA polymerase specialized sigma24 family protein